MLGKFEELILLALIRVGPDQPASAIFEVITDRLNQEKSFGAVYTTLDRMVDKKYIKVSSPKVSSGKGKKRRYFTISGEGRAALSQSMNMTNSMADGLSLEGQMVG